MKGKAGFRSLLVVLVLVLLVQIPVAGAVGDSQDVLDSAVSASPDAPIIIVWYGDTQNFGVLGNPQKQINILGSVISANELYYELNDSGQWRPLSIGTGWSPTLPPPPPPPLLSSEMQAQAELDLHGLSALLAAGNKRLSGDGDFNIEIFTNELRQGANKVVIKAIGSGETTKQVTVNYSNDKVWPMPYTLDWSDYSNIQEVLQAGKAQVVDGKWHLEDGWLHTEEIGYDRGVAIGDMQWKDFDLLVPIHLGEFPSYNEGNIGLMIRWQGHIKAKEGEQPLTGWWDSGVFGLYRHYSYTPPEEPIKSRLEMFYSHFDSVDDTSGFTVKRSEPYYWRLRVQTTEAAPYGLFSMKVWKSSDEEPSDWIFPAVKDLPPEALETGSLVLVAHYSDAKFGKVEVKPFVDVIVTTSGPGSVEVSPEVVAPPDAHLLGDTITLTATPTDPANYAFAGWSGDLTGMENPASLTLDKEEVRITATFAPKRTLTVGIDPAAAGQVALDPPGGVYGDGTVVKLTPMANANFAFDGWSGPNQSDLTDLGNGSYSITMNADKNVTAKFVPGYTLTITTDGQGTVETDPPGLGFKAGTSVKLTAKPAWGWFFAGWQGDLQGRENPAWLTMTSDKAVQANFIVAKRAFLPLIVRNSR